MKFLKNSSWLFVAALLAFGCGGEQGPTASQGVALESSSQERSFLAFAPEGRVRAAKLAIAPTDAAVEGRTVSAVFMPDENGVLRIAEELDIASNSDLAVSPNNYLAARFNVRKGALEEPVLITMTVYGESLSDMVVAFQPAGLEFLEMAVLRLALGGAKVDLPLYDLHAWHIYNDGTVEEVGFSILDEPNGILFKIDVPGFSRYSMGGGS